MNRHRNLRKIVHEERVYHDVFPLVLMYQGFWLAAGILFSLMSLLPIIFFDDYLALFSMNSLELWSSLIGSLILTLVYLAISLYIGVSICRMRRWFGVVALLYCIPALAFSMFMLVFLIILSGNFVSDGENVPTFLYLTFIGAMGSFLLPFGYSCFLGILAGRRLTFASSETRLIVSEIRPKPRLRSDWFSKVIGMPVPIRFIKKNRVISLILFLASGVLLSAVPTFAFFSIAFISSTLIFSIWDFSQFFAGEPFGTMLQLMRYSPLVFGCLAIFCLVLGKATRTKAREVSITSLRESQQTDRRPPILFLRSFYDDQIALAAPKLPFLGGLATFLKRKGSLDILLLEECTVYGPLVALGNPYDPLPPYGAARGYFSNNNWQKGVEQLANDSHRIIICVDITEGVLWEVEFLIRQGHTKKTLFLMHPRARDPVVNKNFRQEIISRIRSKDIKPLYLGDLKEKEEPVIGFFFKENGDVNIGVSYEFSEASYMLMIRWFLRTVTEIN